MDVLRQGAALAHPDEFLIGVLGHQEGGPHAEQQHRAAGADEVHAPADDLRLYEHTGVLQRGDVAVGYLVDDVRQLVGVLQLPAGVGLVLLADGQLAQQGLLQIAVALEPQLPADADHRGGRRVALLGQPVDAALGRRLRVLQHPVQDPPLRAAGLGPVLVHADQNVFHRPCSSCRPFCS